MNRPRIVGGIAIGLLLVASLVAAFLQPSALDVARGQCVERGFQTENLALLGYRGSGSLINKRVTVEFQVKGGDPPKRATVELRQPIYFLAWQVVDFREEARQ